MASQPAPSNALPLLYNDLVPLSSVDHGSWRAQPQDSVPYLRTVHAIPITVEEFPLAQRHYPLIFSVGDNPVPLALMALNEGMNVFVDEEGKFRENAYIPAYIRRYPFMLAKLRPDADELSLCFDPTTRAIGPFDEGEPLFEDGKPTEAVTRILSFCEQFEGAAANTGRFMEELANAQLLMEGEVSIQVNGQDQPYIYRGFQMIDETKLRDLRGDQLRKKMQNGMLPLIHAHLFSLTLVEGLFGRAAAQGLLPQNPAPQVVPAA